MRLIDADKLYPDCLTKTGRLAISQSQIAEAPTVERPKGEWILSDFTKLYYCSVCGNESICHLLNEPEPNFCSFCGADMRIKSELKDELNELKEGEDE